MTADVMSRFVAPTSHAELHPTMGQGVAERTYLRKVLSMEELTTIQDHALDLNPNDPNFREWFVAAHNSNVTVNTDESAPFMDDAPKTRWENWAEVGHRVAAGNVALLKTHGEALPIGDDRRDNLGEDRFRVGRMWTHADEVPDGAVKEYTQMSRFIADGKLLMSGRHLQHGDPRQPNRNQEVFTNCATSPTSFGLFMLLLNGSGVGRDYSDEMMAVDWAKDMPLIVAVLDENHPDFKWGQHVSSRDAQHLYKQGKEVHWHKVSDSREGWSRAVEAVEITTYRNGLNRQKIKRDNRINVLILDFTEVRGEGSPIMGMQGRPSSGPVPLMDAIGKIAKVKGTGLKPWLATLYIDHYLAEPVLVGGARRSARMSTKDWRDEDILEFIAIKRPVEYEGLIMRDVQDHRAQLAAAGMPVPQSFLWSSNNSIAVDADFWDRVYGPITSDPLTMKAKMVFQFACECGYGDGTGEPGFINVDKLEANQDGITDPVFVNGQYMDSKKYPLKSSTQVLLYDLYERFRKMPYQMICNPCGEENLSILGGFCVIADIVPFHCVNLNEVIEVAKAATRALIRVNTMDSIFNAEVHRANRIGVSMTGVHEFAWKFFQVSFADLVTPDFEALDQVVEAHESANAKVRSAAFWSFMGDLSRAIRDEADRYSAVLGVNPPHTVTTIKPSGTVSKLFGLTEGWHLPAMKRYVRWVQYHNGSPLLQEYKDRGFPTRELKNYKDHTIVGFPTEPTLVKLNGIEDYVVTASEASMQEQFQWLRLGEFFYLEGGTPQLWYECHGSVDDLIELRAGVQWGSQISYTMKYKEEDTSFEMFRQMILENQPGVRCVSVMPHTDAASYEYLPEEDVTLVRYREIEAAIDNEDGLAEDIGEEHMVCEGGACPIEFNQDAK